MKLAIHNSRLGRLKLDLEATYDEAEALRRRFGVRELEVDGAVALLYPVPAELFAKLRDASVRERECLTGLKTFRPDPSVFKAIRPWEEYARRDVEITDRTYEAERAAGVSRRSPRDFTVHPFCDEAKQRVSGDFVPLAAHVLLELSRGKPAHLEARAAFHNLTPVEQEILKDAAATIRCLSSLAGVAARWSKSSDYRELRLGVTAGSVWSKRRMEVLTEAAVTGATLPSAGPES